MVTAVIFDIDGTLVGSVDLHAEAWQRAMRRFGRDVPFERIRREIGKGADQLLPVFFTGEELRRFGEELKELRADLYVREYLAKVRPFPEVPALFRRLRDDGRRIALASSGRREEVEALIDLAGVRGLIEGATSADDVERSKPHPDVLEAALDRLGPVDLREVVTVGDTPYDAEAAGKLGLSTIGLLCGGWAEMDLVEAGCVEIYRDPGDLLARYEESMLAPVRRKKAPSLRLAS